MPEKQHVLCIILSLLAHMPEKKHVWCIINDKNVGTHAREKACLVYYKERNMLARMPEKRHVLCIIKRNVGTHA